MAEYQGGPELIVNHLFGRPVPEVHPRLYRNKGDGTFQEVSLAVGLSAPSLPMGANFGDIDNDGFLDFYLGTGLPSFQALMPNLMYRNLSGQRFVDVTYSGGFGHLQKGHGVAFGDIDNDGDQDIFEEMGGGYPGDTYPNALYENPGHGNGWITLKLVGNRTNRAALGTRITIEVETASGTRSIHRQVGTGGSFGGSPVRAEIGLGDAVKIRRLEVYWPVSDLRQSFEGVLLNGAYQLVEGGELIAVTLPKIELGKNRNAPHHHSDAERGLDSKR